MRFPRAPRIHCVLFAVVMGQLHARAGEAPHWSFQPPQRPRVPTVRPARLIRNPIDAFILSALEKKGLAPLLEADRRTLLRRVTFDLIGLPPTPEETAAFVAERSSTAYEQVVTRLLASPQYGERWAQHWLDVVRFGETNGYELDAERPQAWRYRDWVIRALNEDKPYDRFLIEQIAGDEIDPDDFELRVATGFLRGGPRHVVGGNLDPREVRQEWLTEAVQGIGNAVLGLTIQCARCHDHKYDPIPQNDYYRLAAFFAGADNFDKKAALPGEQAAYEAAMNDLKERKKPIEAQIAAIEKPYREQVRAQKLARLDAETQQALNTELLKRTPRQVKLAQEAQRHLNLSWDDVVNALRSPHREQRAALRNQLHELDLRAPEPPRAAPGVGESLKPLPPTHVLVRGDYSRLGEAVEPGFIRAVTLEPSPLPGVGGQPAHSASRRLALARWLTRPDHPLTARVIVNRLWHYHFGRGLVTTPNDFGKNGQRPSHPELLDWLAITFVRDRGSDFGCGRSLKQMHYLMVTSATYRQQRAPQRLDAEALRDTILHVAGTLTPQMHGPSVRVPLEPEVYDQIFTEAEPDNLWPVTPDVSQHTRRSLYLLRKRNVRLPMLVAFDAPDMMTSCAARQQSVHALQALTLMNSDFMAQQARALARRVMTEAKTDEMRIMRLFALALNREPCERELVATQKFLSDQVALLRRRQPTDEARMQTWADLCLATLNRNEFLFVR